MKKQEARIWAKDVRKSISEEKRLACSQQISLNLIGNFDFDQFDQYLFFYPLPGEISLLSLATQLHSVGKLIAFPKVEGDDMDFYIVRNIEADFKKGVFNVMEPITTLKADLRRTAAFVPGLAFDGGLYRVGYGKGYYDKYFTRFSEIYRIGICPNQFFIPEIETDEYDRPMDMVVTETTNYYIGH